MGWKNEVESAMSQLVKEITSTETRLTKINDTMVAIREKELLINHLFENVYLPQFTPVVNLKLFCFYLQM